VPRRRHDTATPPCCPTEQHLALSRAASRQTLDLANVCAAPLSAFCGLLLVSCTHAARTSDPASSNQRVPARVNDLPTREAHPPPQILVVYPACTLYVLRDNGIGKRFIHCPFHTRRRPPDPAPWSLHPCAMAHGPLMRVIPALGLCRLGNVSHTRTHDALLRHRVRSRSALPRMQVDP
jgi:hypothetical protein